MHLKMQMDSNHQKDMKKKNIEVQGSQWLQVHLPISLVLCANVGQ